MKNRLIAMLLLGAACLPHCCPTAIAQTVTTLAATSIGQTNATLNGTVLPPVVTEAYFQFGLTASYDNLGGFLMLPPTNTAQALPGLAVNALHSPAGAYWTQTSAPGSNNWYSIASSADGTRLFAAVSGAIYASTNSGTTWTQTSAPNELWLGIASSADGMRLVAVTPTYGIFTSTNGGTTWAQTSADPYEQYQTVASSADGMRLFAAAYTRMYVSADGGGTWTLASITGNSWNSIACSADGMRVLAANGPGVTTGPGFVDLSTDGGVTWTTQTSLPDEQWTAVAISADGTRMIAAAAGGGIYFSFYSGSTWVQSTAPAEQWQSVCMSADGSRAVAAAYGAGGIYTSPNGGSAWVSSAAPVTLWRCLAASADCTRLAGGIWGGGIFTSGGATNGLAPGTTYHYRAVAGSSHGTVPGADGTFTTSAGAPTPSTLPASGITATNATLAGSLFTGGLATSAYFRYGLTTNYGSFSATNLLAATNIAVSVSNLIGSLSPGTTYHFALVSSNSAGKVTGGDLTFITLPLPPVMTTLAASGVTASNATLNGKANPNSGLTQAYFQYGLTTNYGNETAETQFPATNATLNLPGQVVASVLDAGGINWALSSAPSAEPWWGIASSADGTRLAAVDIGVGIYISTDSGTTWTLSSAPTANWEAIASSADGTHLAAVTWGGTIYVSADGGNTWTGGGAPAGYWQGVASSRDGTHLAAVNYYGGIATSTNGGGTWTVTSAPSENWTAIASSGDGLRLVALARYNGIYTSTNGGSTWVSNSAPGLNWWSVASSVDGTRLAAGNAGGGIYVSTDSGNTWTLSSAPTASWASIASSADGMRLAAAVPNVGVYTSTDGGASWTIYSHFFVQLQSICSSAEGTQLALVVGGSSHTGGIWTSAGTAISLKPGTLYHYRAVGYNLAGTGYGSDLTFTTVAGAPAATTLPATGTTATNATLNGTLFTGGFATSEYFRFGLSTNYGSYTTTNILAATNVSLSVPNLIGNLLANTTYHFQLVASNSAGVSLGSDITFTTLPLPPAAATLPATSLTLTSATLNGSVNPEAETTWAYFQYGLTTNYGYFGGFMSLPATSSTLTMPGLVVSALRGTAGTNWTQTTAPATNWNSIASSADGSRLAAVVKGDGIYTSTNSGSTWTRSSAPATNWYSIASSADGMRLAAVVNGGGVYTSTNGGSIWTATSLPTANWFSIASSADGMRLATVIDGGSVYISANGGITWTPANGSSASGASIACSADGLRLALAIYGGPIWTSPDAGASWTQTSGSSPGPISIACSADGIRLAIAIYGVGGGVWTSTNSGINWTLTSLPTNNWNCIASSADGLRLVAGKSGGGLYTSTDGGVTWTQGNAPSTNWTSLACSADGTQLAAVAGPGSIYTCAGTTSPLTSGTNYHFRVVGLNNTGTSFGGDLTFSMPTPPAPTTLAATSITATNATLNGTVNPNGAATFAYFRYGLTTSYGSYSATNALAATNAILSVSNGISNLAAGTTYHFQLVAGNVAGTNAGADLTFTTGAAAPAATTLAATSITATNATFNGTVNPNGAAAAVYFRYGLTTAYGSYSATNTLVATNVSLSVSNLINGLTPGTVYHFQLVASNSAGTNAGTDLTLTTSPVAPTATTLAATGVTATNATLTGTVKPNGAATTAYFRYGLTTSYGNFSAINHLAATNATLSVSNLVGSLTPGTTYHFQLVASNSVGTNAGADMPFTTTSAQAVNFSLSGAAKSPGGAFQFSFTNLSGLSFTVLGATNPALPLTNWTVLGLPVEGPPGQYQFTDPQATNLAIRFYRVRSP